MRGTRVPAFVSSDFRCGTEAVGRLGRSCARTSKTTRNRESAPPRTELGGGAGSLRMPVTAGAQYRRASTGASRPAAHQGSRARHLGASYDAGAPRYARVRPWRFPEATGAPRRASVSGHEKTPSTCQRLRVDYLLERTWASSNDQAPANARVQLHASQIKARGEAARHPQNRLSIAATVIQLAEGNPIAGVRIAEHSQGTDPASESEFYSGRTRIDGCRGLGRNSLAAALFV
jgi:hypothetical protein